MTVKVAVALLLNPVASPSRTAPVTWWGPTVPWNEIAVVLVGFGTDDETRRLRSGRPVDVEGQRLDGGERSGARRDRQRELLPLERPGPSGQGQ